jgi:hypothetical protein
VHQLCAGRGQFAQRRVGVRVGDRRRLAVALVEPGEEAVGGGDGRVAVEAERLENFPLRPAGQRVEGPRENLAADPRLDCDDGERLTDRIRVHERVVKIEHHVARNRHATVIDRRGSRLRRGPPFDER